MGDLQAVDDRGRGVRRALFAPAAEPAPAAVGELHFGEPLDACFDDLCQLGFVEHRVVLEPQPILGPLGIVAEFLGIQVGALLLDLLEIEAQSRSVFCVITAGRKRLSVCSVQP